MPPPKTQDKIRQPARVKACNGTAFSNFFYENAPAEHVFVRGALSFPRFDKREGKYKGAISVCALNVQTKRIKLLYIANFDFYTFRFWTLLRKVFEKYGTNAFYFDASQKEDKQKLILQAMREIESGKKYIYPELFELTFSSDFYAYQTLFQKIAEGNFMYSAKSDFLTASIFWDETKSFADAPAELQAVCLNIYGLERDILYYEQQEKELLYNDVQQ